MGINFFHLELCCFSFINWFGLLRFGITPGVQPEGDEVPKSEYVSTNPQSSAGRAAVKWAGVALITINAIFGFLKITSGWPFACYPTFFRVLKAPLVETTKIYGVANSQEFLIDLNDLKELWDPDRVKGILDQIFDNQNPDGLKELNAFVTVLDREGVNLRNYSKLRFYKVKYSSLPEHVKAPFVARRLVGEVDLRTLS